MAVLVVAGTVLSYGNQPDARPLDLLGYALLATMALGLVWVRDRPELSLAVSALAAAAYFALGYAYAMWPAPALVAMFATIASGRRVAGWAGAAFLVAVPALAVVLHPEVDSLVGVAMWALIVLVVAQPAEVSRARRAYTTEVESRAEEAERTREEEALRRAQEERLTIARELHDVTSHTVSVIALHAAVAAEAVERAGGPEAAREALAVIRTASREALAELKGVLTVLRAPPQELRPAPGSAQVAELVATAGLPVAYEEAGERRPLPPAVDLTVYRVVQEALTNTMRHARAGRATVLVRYDEEGVHVQVDDDGTGAGQGGSGGHGLAGMDERVRAVGGTLTTGDGPGGGFRVVAWLPT